MICGFSITYSSHRLKVGGSLVLKVVRVGDLARSPGSLVGGVVNERCRPLALVLRVLLHRGGPGATSGDIGTSGIGDGRSEPVTILLVIPVFGLLGLRIGDGQWLILQPVFRLSGFLVDNLIGSLLIPVFRLGSFGVSDLDFVNPVTRLLVLGVVNLLGGVDSGSKVLQESTVLDVVAVNQDLEGLVGLDDEGVDGGGLLGARDWRAGHVLLLVFTSLGVLVFEDEVNLSRVSISYEIAYKCILTLLVLPHLSGPNMITYGEALENSSAWSFLFSCRSFR